jgi:hypothetical protein
MISTTKQRIAREWLVFLTCIVIGFIACYFTFYAGRTTEWITDSNNPSNRPILDPWKGLTYKPGKIEHHSRHLGVGDLWNSLQFQSHKSYYGGDSKQEMEDFIHYYDDRITGANHHAGKLWLFILAPYLVVMFLRLNIWAVNTLRRR